MINGLKFLDIDEANQSIEVYADDHDTYNFDNEDDFLDNAVAFMSRWLQVLLLRRWR